jgi:Ca2+:H+ antiporter
VINPSLKKSSILYIFLISIPVAVIVRLINADTTIQFIVAAVALIPLSKMIGDSTEDLSLYYGMTIGSLLMVTLGNSTEIIVGIVSINEGLFDLVKDTMIGGILANILLIPD